MFALVGCATSPGLEADAVQKSMQFRMRDFMGCFEENYKRPESGKYRLSFTIGDDGSIYGASPDRETQTLPKSGIFDDCMIGVLKETAFPVPAGSGEVKVNYPFYFTWSPEKPADVGSPSTEQKK
jgi:hypothetical protein